MKRWIFILLVLPLGVMAQVNRPSSGGGSPEGTDVKSTGETGGTKYLREDGDGTSSWQAVSDGDTSYFDLSGNRITTKTDIDEIAVDTLRADVALFDLLGSGVYELNIDGVGDIDTLLAPIDTASLMKNYVLVADSAKGVMMLIHKDSVGGGGEWTLSGDYVTPTTANNVYVPDSLTVGESGGTSGVVKLLASDGDDAFIYLNTSNELYISDASKYTMGGFHSDGTISSSGIGLSHTIAALYSTAIGRSINTLSGDSYSVGLGYRGQSQSYGEMFHSSGYFASAGDAQGGEYIARISTTHADATWYTLYNDGSSETIDIPASSAWFFRADIVMTSDAQDTTAAYTIEGHIKRDASNNTTLMGTPTVTTHYETFSDYLVQVVADDTNEALAIQCQLTTGHTGASTVRRWVARIETTQVIF